MRARALCYAAAAGCGAPRDDGADVDDGGPAVVLLLGRRHRKPPVPEAALVIVVVKMHNDHGEPQPSRRCCRNCTTYSGHPNSEPNVYEGCLAVGLLLYIIQSVEF